MLPTSGRVSSNMNENKSDEAYDPDAFVAVTLIVYNRYGVNWISSRRLTSVECFMLSELMLMLDNRNQSESGLEVEKKASAL